MTKLSWNAVGSAYFSTIAWAAYSVTSVLTSRWKGVASQHLIDELYYRKANRERTYVLYGTEMTDLGLCVRLQRVKV